MFGLGSLLGTFSALQHIKVQAQLERERGQRIQIRMSILGKTWHCAGYTWKT